MAMKSFSLDTVGNGVSAIDLQIDEQIWSGWTYTLQLHGTETDFEVRLDEAQLRSLIEQSVSALCPEESADILARLP
jgi:hypothetical protein